MDKPLKLLYLAVGTLIFALAIGLIFIYEKHIAVLEEALKVEIIWRFLEGFGT